jgi:hypothetical protein
MAINFKRLEEISRALKTTEQTGKCFHTTFIFHGSKLLSISKNNYTKSHRSHKYGEYVSRRGVGTYTAAMHGELSAILKLGLTNCSHLTFVNIRIDNNNNPAKSKPCINCQRILDSVGYKYLHYYDGEKYIKEKYKL